MYVICANLCMSVANQRHQRARPHLKLLAKLLVVNSYDGLGGLCEWGYLSSKLPRLWAASWPPRIASSSVLTQLPTSRRTEPVVRWVLKRSARRSIGRVRLL